MIELERQSGAIVPIGTVESYPSASLNDDPLLYPGVRPEASFLLDGNDVFAVETTDTDGGLQFELRSLNGSTTDLDAYLEKKGVPKMADRIPILGYGANMCPASIKSKFTKVGRPDAEIVPTIYGQLNGFDVVWSGGPGVNGNFIANLYNGPETEQTTATVGVNFLTTEQLLVMHATELSYDLSTVDVDVDGAIVKALVYAGVDDILIRDGKPVAVSAIKAHGRDIEVATTRELLDDMLRDEDILQALQAEGVISEGIDADAYVAQTKELVVVPGAKLARKRVVHGVMSRLGKSRVFKLSQRPERLQTWANPSNIPTYGEQLQGIYHKDVYVLPNQVLDADKWPDKAKRDLVLRGVGTHFMRMTGLDEKK